MNLNLQKTVKIIIYYLKLLSKVIINLYPRSVEAQKETILLLYLAESETEPSLQIAIRIVRGMQLFGAYKNEEAKEFIGELGWKVVQYNGGWQEIFYNTNIKYISLFKKKN